LISTISIYRALLTFLLTIVYSSTFSQNLRSKISIESETIEKRKLTFSVWPVEITSDTQWIHRGWKAPPLSFAQGRYQL
jgi:hypothetical protein